MLEAIERVMLASLAGRLGQADSERSDRSDYWIESHVMDRYDPSGMIHLTVSEKNIIIRSYAQGSASI
jgi:hypothetical protein